MTLIADTAPRLVLPLMDAVSVDDRDTFEALVTAHVRAYRTTPVGADLVAIFKPELVPADVESKAKMTSRRHSVQCGGYTAGFFATFAGICSFAALPSLGAAVLGVALIAVGAVGTVVAVRCRGAGQEAWHAQDVRSRACWQRVPGPVAAAYEDYRGAPLRLRRLDAPAVAIDAVEENLAHVEDLLVCLSDLWKVGAGTTSEAEQIAGAMFAYAAKAKALETLAQRRRAAVEVAALDLSVLLDGHHGGDLLALAGGQLAEETRWVQAFTADPLGTLTELSATTSQSSGSAGAVS